MRVIRKDEQKRAVIIVSPDEKRKSSHYVEKSPPDFRLASARPPGVEWSYGIVQ